MNKIQLRKKRMQIKAERMAILLKIDDLQEKLKQEKDKEKRKEIRADISQLGKELERKVVANISDHDFVKNEEFQDFGRKKEAWSMSVKKYIEYKKRGLLDKEIIKKEGISKHQLLRWKKRNGITRKTWVKAAKAN